MTTEKDLGIQQVPFRIKKEKYETLKTKLTTDGLKFQKLVTCFVEAYLNDDPTVRDFLKNNGTLVEPAKDVFEET